MNRSTLSQHVEALEGRLLAGSLSRRQFVKLATAVGGMSAIDAAAAADRASMVATNQRARQATLRKEYDYIVCGSGSSGSVVARRLAENPDVHVLLLEAGGTDDISTVIFASSYPLIRFQELFWRFDAAPELDLNHRAIVQMMGKVMGGGSSVNTMVWARGHKSDFDHWAQVSKDPSWGYANALRLYRKAEDWQGASDPERRGRDGPVWVQTAQAPCPLAPAMLRSAASAGIPTFADHNGEMMEGDGGAALANLIVKDGRRRNMAVSYLYPIMHQPNLTVLTAATVHRVDLVGRTAVGVTFEWRGETRRALAARETVLSMGAFNSPRTLMLSGIGDQDELRRLDLPVVQHLPGVGRNFQDHTLVATCLWEGPGGLTPNNNKAEATLFWKSDASLIAPDIQPFLIEVPHLSEKHAQYSVPNAWSLSPSIIRPRSRGHFRLRSTNPNDGVDLHWNPIGDPEEMRVLKFATALCREIGNGPDMREFAKRELLPGPIYHQNIEEFIRNGVTSYGHASCTAKMGYDISSVVDSDLRVHGIEKLRVVDGSIMPTITTGNTMAPCVLIGENAAEKMRA